MISKGFRDKMTTRDKIHSRGRIYFKEIILILTTTVIICKRVFMFPRAKIVFKMHLKLTKMKMLLHAPVDSNFPKNSKF